MGKHYPRLPNGGSSLEAIEVMFTVLGGKPFMIITDERPMQISIDRRDPINSILPVIGKNAGELQLVLREIIELRARLCALEGVDPPPYVDTEEELKTALEDSSPSDEDDPTTPPGSGLLPSK